MNEAERLARVDGTGAVRRVELRATIDAPVERVWAAITEPEATRHWWTGGIIEPREGGRVALDDGSEVNGTVITFRPPYVFEFTWNDIPERAGHPQYIDRHTSSLTRFDLVEAGI